MITDTTPILNHPAALQFKLKAINKRLAALDQFLNGYGPLDEWLYAVDRALQQKYADLPAVTRARAEERRHLHNVRGVVTRALAALPPNTRYRLRKKDAGHERSVQFIRAEIATRTEKKIWFIQKLERGGELRQAAIHRAALLDLGAEICREFSLRPEILADVEPVVPVDMPEEEAA